MGKRKEVTKKDLILSVLKDGRKHSGAEFLSGVWGFRCSSYSQRIGDLQDEGYNIKGDRRGPDGLGLYWLVPDDRLFPVEGGGDGGA